MKFGRRLLTNLTPEWKSQYIPYEYMKKLLDEAVAAAPVVIDGQDNSSREQYFVRADEAFFEYCEKQEIKINTFFAEKLAEALRRSAALKDEIQYRETMYGQPSPPSKPSATANQPANEDSLLSGDVSGMKSQTQQPTLIVPLAGILPDRLVKNPEEQEKQLMKLKQANNLKVAFSEFYLMLVLLQNFQLLNFTGFRKILKKHDKLFQTTRGDAWRKSHVDTAIFWKSTAVMELIQDVETLYTDALESGDRPRAMKRLRVPTLAEKQPPIVTFRVGIFVGMICILVPVLIILISVLSTSRLGNPLHWREALHLYRSTFLIISQIIFVSINVYGWSSSGVNHILIFEIDPRHHLTYQQLLEIGVCLCVLWLLSFIAFVVMSHLDFYPFTQPLIFLILITLFLINPISILYRPARYWLLKVVRQIFSAGFHPILFAEFWLADQMTSLELAFFDLQYIFCFYTSNYQWWSTNLTSSASLKGAFCTGWTTYLLQASLLALPSLLRLVQCIRRYHDSKHDPVHMANAGKYLTTILVAITNSVRRATALKYPGNPKRNPFLYVWIITAFASSTYKLIWDLKMDWGFFDKKAGRNKFLREQIVYSRKVYYYSAIIEDIIFRYIWIINIFVEFSPGTAEYSDFIRFAFALVEIFRRFIWNFFRLENEHLNNCGKFRAVRDISIAPIATGINFELLHKKLKKEPGIQNRRNRMAHETSDEEENIEAIDNTTMADLENNTGYLRNHSASIYSNPSVSEVNEINKMLQNIVSKRRHTLMPVEDEPGVSYPILRVVDPNKILTPSKSL